MFNVLSLSVICATCAPAPIVPTIELGSLQHLATARFKVDGGSIAVTLPTNFRAEDRISGLVIAEPEGKTPGELRSNSAVLQGYVVELADGSATPQKNRLTAKISPAALLAGLPLLLKDDKGHIVGKADLVGFAPEPFPPLPGAPPPPTTSGQKPPDLSGPEPYRAQPPIPPTISGQSAPDPNGPEPYRIQPICRPGQPITISGPFDGDASNTAVSASGDTAVVLAETPRETIVQNSATKPGPTLLHVKENGKEQDLKTNNLTVSLSMPKNTLVPGDKTQVTVQVQGMDGMPKQAFPVKLQLTNLSPNVVTMEGGTKVTASITECKSFNMPLALTANHPGGFSIEAELLSGYNPYPRGYNDDRDHPIPMDGIDTVGDLENYSIRRLMDTLRDLRQRKLWSTEQHSNTDWLDEKIKLIKRAIKQRGIDPGNSLIDPE